VCDCTEEIFSTYVAEHREQLNYVCILKDNIEINSKEMALISMRTEVNLFNISS
jgi:hypothetical protein